MPGARYDVFLSHSSQDKPLVRELATVLKGRGLRVWLDEWELRPGVPWQEELEAAIEKVKAAAVLYGPAGIGPWADREMRAFLDEFVRRKCPVIPVLLPGSQSEPKLPPFLRAFTWVDLRSGLSSEGIDRLVWGITGQRPTGALAQPPEPAHQFKRWNVPPLPREYQARAELDAIKHALLSTDARAFALTGQHARFAVQGMGGVGKSVLAAALAREPEVEQTFPDGIFWLALGQQPEGALLVQARLATAMGGAQVSLKSVEAGKTVLRELFASRACLLVLDDVWDSRHVEPFNVLGKRGKLLVTTRKAEVVRGIGAESRVLHELSEAEALELLARYAGRRRDGLPARALELAQQCGELPLAIAMVGALLRDRPDDRWPSMVERLRGANLARIKAALPEYPHDSLLAALEVSVEELPEAMRDRYLDLAVFPEDIPIPEGVLHTFWAPIGLDKLDVQDLADMLVDRSLVRRDNTGQLTLHDLQYDYLRARTGDLKPLHARLLAAYRKLGAEKGLHTVPDDGYFFQHVAHHVLAAKGPSALRTLLFDFRWLAAKLAATETNALLADFQFLDLGADEPARLLQGALRLSSNALDRNPGELAGQLIGRLGDGAPKLRNLVELMLSAVRHFFRDDKDAPELRNLVNNARALAGRPGLIPLWSRLTPPGGPLVRTFKHDQLSLVTAVALSPDGRHALSGSSTLKLWDVASGTLVRTFKYDQQYPSFASINAIALSPDGRHALSGSDDKTLRLWDVASGKLVRIFKGHQSMVTAVALSGDGRYALSGSSDNTLKLWDVTSGTLVRTFGDRHGWATAVTLSADGRHALSGSPDNTLKLWDVTSGTLVRTFEGHQQHSVFPCIDAVALSADGRIALSVSFRHTLKLWDVASGTLVRTFEGYGVWSRAIALSADGRHALSGFSDNTLKLWNGGSGTLVRTFEGHQESVLAVALSADGRHALSGSQDNTLKLWNISSGHVLASFTGDAAFCSLAFHPHGRQVIAGDVFGRVHLLEVRL